MSVTPFSDDTALPPTWQKALLPLAVLGLAAGAIVHVAMGKVAAHWVWGGATLLVLVPNALSALRGVVRREPGVDVIAVLSMAGALVLKEELAGAIIGVMLTGGAALERFAVARAHRELTALLTRAPRVAHRREPDGMVDVDVSKVALGDVLAVKAGEVIPTDGVLTSANAVLDESALTGESRPVAIEAGAPIRSGGMNAGVLLEMRVTAPAEESTYAGIIRLIRAAEQSKSAFVRLADRYATYFLLLTLVVSGLAFIASGSSVRALAVLVVATPCPLILAAPAAIIAGVSLAAKHGIIMKGGAPLEALANVKVLLLDKTGTVTMARPDIVSVESFGSTSSDELVMFAASIEQASVHPYAPAFLSEAKTRGMPLAFPSAVREKVGAGVAGDVNGHHVAVGQLSYVASSAGATKDAHALQTRATVEGTTCIHVAVDGSPIGAVLMQDPIRPEAPRALRSLRAEGIERIHMVTGDRPDVAELVGDALGVDRVFAERTPDEKVEVVQRARSEGATAMVGDGINDAPALALADVGIAMGARGATAASEAADVVLTSDRLDSLVLAVRIARRTRRIAQQSVFTGMGLSLVAMLFAAAGYLAPVAGAVLQEGIDILVILNALRALGGGTLHWRTQGDTKALARALASVHRGLKPYIGELSSIAARLDTLSRTDARARLEQLYASLEQELLPHERDEQEHVYPLLSKMLGEEDPTGPLIQTHQEIRRLTRLFGRLVQQLSADGTEPYDFRDIRRVLYGLHAILSLHFAQEDDLYSLLEA
jgi:heavy metal translocating P-type ATPase